MDIVNEIREKSHWQPDLTAEIAGFLFRDKNAFKVRLMNCIEVGSRDINLWKNIARRHGYTVHWSTKHESTSLVFEKKRGSFPLYLLPLACLVLKQLVKLL